MFGILIFAGFLASALLSARVVDFLRDRTRVQDGRVAIPVESPKRRHWH